MSGVVLFVGLVILGAAVCFVGLVVKVLAGDLLAEARRRQGKAEPGSTKAFSRGFIVSMVVVVAIATAIGVVYEVRQNAEERAQEAREEESATSQWRRRDPSNEGGGPLPRGSPGAQMPRTASAPRFGVATSTSYPGRATTG